MPSLTIYTDPNKVGQCDVPPFVIGDSSDQWTLKFNDGLNDYTPDDVSIRVGHVNGLTQSRASAFRLNDRGGNYGIYDILKVGDIYAMALNSLATQNIPPELLGSNGVYLARGIKVARGIKQLYLISKGNGYVRPPRIVISGDGVGATAEVTMSSTLSSKVDYVRHNTPTKYGETITAVVSGGGGTGAQLNDPQLEKFTVTGLKIGAIALASFIIGAVGQKVPLVFSGLVVSGYTAAEGYAEFHSAPYVSGGSTAYLKQLVLTRQGTYSTRPTVTFTPNLTQYSCIADGEGTYLQNAVHGGAGYTSTPTAFWAPSGSGLTLGTPVFADATPIGTSGPFASIPSRITSIPITNGGSGYNYTPRIRISGGGSATDSICENDVRAVVNGGIVTDIVINSSACYSASTLPTALVLTIEVPPAQSSIVITSAQASGELRSIEITDGGAGYTSAPAVSITAIGAGSGANCVARLSDGIVIGVDIIDPGWDYSAATPPTVSFTGGDGTGAAATCMVNEFGTINSISITEKGAGYTSATVEIIADDGIGTGAVAGVTFDVETHEVCFKQSEASLEVIGGVSVTPHTDGRTSANGQVYYDNAMVILRPRVVADGSLSVDPDGNWSGTLNPVNDYVRAVLSIKRSLTLDLQVFGDGRMLFMGALTILNKIQ